MKVVIYILMLVFCVLVGFALYFGFEQTIAIFAEESQDSTKIQLDRIERKLNLIIPDFKKAGYKYDFESENYEVEL